MKKLSPKAKLMGEVFRLYMAGLLVVTMVVCLLVRYALIKSGITAWVQSHFQYHIDVRYAGIILMVSWIVVLAKYRRTK